MDSKPPIDNLTCTDCVYYVDGHCEWARENFCPPWIQEAKPVAPEMGAECDCWEQNDE